MISLSSRLGSRFSSTAQRLNLYSLPKRLKDVTKIRGLQNNSPFIQLDDYQLQLKYNQHLGYLSSSSNRRFLFYDQDFNIFDKSTPVLRLFRENFYVQEHSNIYFIINNEPIIKQPVSAYFRQTEGSSLLEVMIGQTLRELQDMDTIDRQTLHNYLMKDVVDNADQLKLDKIRYKELLKFVEGRIQQFQEHIKAIELRLQSKAKNRVKLFTSFLIAQAAIVQYFIYFNLSWDIMEPITVIMGNLDILVAYYFFLVKGRTYSPETWHKNIVEAKKYRYLSKQGLNIAKYQEYIQIKSYLQMRLGLLSKNPTEYLDTIEKPFKMLNTR